MFEDIARKLLSDVAAAGDDLGAVKSAFALANHVSKTEFKRLNVEAVKAAKREKAKKLLAEIGE